MSTTKTKPAPNGAPGANAPQEPPTYRINPEVEGKIDAYIKENPKYWNYLQTMPRDRLERTVVLNEVRQIERQQRMREGIMKRINDDPKLKSAYEILVKDVPEDQREEVMTQMARQKQRTVARSQMACVDVIREAGATVVAAAQSTTSLIPPLGNDKSKVLTLNLRNRMIFRSADEADAVQAADFIGKKRVVKRSWGYNAGKRNVNYNEIEEHKIRPHKLRNLCDHECVLVHCERGFRRVTLPPLEADGTIAKWFSWWRKMF